VTLQSLIHWLLPREEHFYHMLEELARLSHEAAKALERFKDRPADEVQTAVQSIEHQADDIVRRMEDALARTFVTPIDREDLHRLTSELDDIIDLANLTARALGLYNINHPTEAMVQLMANLVTVTAMIRDALPRLRKKEFTQLLEEGRRVRQMEKEADTVYRSAISALFRKEQIDFRDLLKEKEALDDLERAVDQCDNVADLLSTLAVKHG
jgi:predicted phosphate transport protein (TIGR00153 family)